MSDRRTDVACAWRSFLCACVRKIKALQTCVSPAEGRATPHCHTDSTPAVYIHNLRPSGMKTFHIPRPCKHFLESGLTGCQNELWEYHPCCTQAQVTTCDLRIHTEPYELQNKQTAVPPLLLPDLHDFPSHVFPHPGHALHGRHTV